MPFNKTSLFYSFAFTLLFFLCCFFYQYFDVVSDYADGIHVWRQSDGLSMAQKYYTEGNSLLQPKMHNQLYDEGMAVGEFPIMYYLVGKLYHVFGNHVWVYRGVWWLFSFLGFFYLYKFCSKFLRSHIHGILISLFTFSSPIVIIYGISFIADPIALFLTFISWYYLLVYHETKNRLLLVFLILLISVSATLKVTSLISILALFGVYGVDLLISKFKGQIGLLDLVKKVIPFLIPPILFYLWLNYATIYNRHHSSTYFFLKFAPIWELSEESLELLNNRVIKWLKEYFYETGRHVLYVFSALIILPIFNKHFNRRYYWFYLLSLVGLISFGLLFYSQFLEHDYYVVNLIFIVPLTSLFFIKKYDFLLKKKAVLISFQVLFAVLVVASVIHGKKRASDRFKFKTIWLDKDLYELKSLLPKYGISKDDLILVPHDPSPNITLYPLDMNGWTRLNGVQHEDVVESKIKEGAKWMLLSDNNPLKDPDIEKYKKNLVVDFKGIKIYALQ